MKRLVALALVLLVCAAASGARAATSLDAIDEGSADYAAQRYDAAAAWYAKLAKTSQQAAAYYDAGNAFYRAGKLGPAVLAYEQALRLDPAHADARYNLEVAHDAIAKRLGKDTVKGSFETPWWIRASEALPLMVLALGALFVDLLLFGVLIWRRLRPANARGGLTALAVPLALVFVVGTTLLFVRIRHQTASPDAIVVADEVIMRELPDPKSREMPILHAGLRVRVMKTVAAWSRVRLANQVEGWVPAETVGRIVE